MCDRYFGARAGGRIGVGLVLLGDFSGVACASFYKGPSVGSTQSKHTL